MKNWNQNDRRRMFKNMFESFINQDFENLGKEMRRAGEEIKREMENFAKEQQGVEVDVDVNFGHPGKDSVEGTPFINVIETSNHYRIELAAPGLSKEQFKITLDEQTLTIAAEESETLQEGERYKKREFYYGKFKRSVKLPEDANLALISAKYEQGILIVNVQKHESAQQKTREIKIS